MTIKRLEEKAKAANALSELPIIGYLNQGVTNDNGVPSETPHFMGKALAVKAAASILVFGSMWLMLEYFWQAV